MLYRAGGLFLLPPTLPFPVLVLLGYNAGVCVSLAAVLFLINSAAAVCLLARPTFHRRQRYGFVALALASLGVKLFLSTRGHNYDVDSYQIVASLVLRGKSVYANTARFNYAPLWAFILAGLKQLSTLLPTLRGEAFHVAVAAFLGTADIAVAALLAAKYRFGSGVFFLCCPATLLLSGYHSQFENVALLAGLAAWLAIRRGSPGPARLLASAALQGLSLVIKHVLFLFPVWILFWSKLGSWRRRVAYVATAYGIFGLSFAPWMFDPASRAGIVRNVFRYRSELNLSLSRLIFSVHPFAAVSAAASWGLTLGWLAVLVAVGIALARRPGDLFPMYLLAMFAFSPALMDQYLAIPLLAGAMLYTRWPSWALAATATVALLSSPANLFHVPFGIAYYTAVVGTQICAAALLVVEWRRLGASRAACLPAPKALQNAATLTFASLAFVFLLFLFKLVAWHGTGAAQPLMHK